MSGIPWLDGAGLAVSLHNTILLLWLGLTVLFNAEKRTWGIRLAGTSLLLASLFFVSHTVILTLGLAPIEPHLDFWWRLGWIPVLVLPFSWYLVVLWYSGFWETAQAAPRMNRQRGWFLLTALLNILLIAALAFAHPLPSFAEVLNLDLSATQEIGGIPILLVAYAVDIFLCVVLSLDALIHSAPTARMMGQLARARARPWLICAAMLLLIIGVLVSAVMAWAFISARSATGSIAVNDLNRRLAGFSHCAPHRTLHHLCGTSDCVLRSVHGQNAAAPRTVSAMAECRDPGERLWNRRRWSANGALANDLHCVTHHRADDGFLRTL